MRGLADHAPAAFVASCLSTAALQCAIFPALSVEAIRADPALRRAVQLMEDRLPLSTLATLQAGDAVPQKVLSKALDRSAADAVMLAAATPQHLQAHLRLVSAVGADAWLHASPVPDPDEKMDSELFRIALARRLRLPLLDAPGACPLCGACLDVFMDHALVCPCGGDRTLRHNSVRNVFHAKACAAGLRAEREKPGLLPPRPDGEVSRGDSLSHGRRPADVWVAGWEGTAAAAIDFAVASGLRADRIAESAVTPGAVWSRYEDFKRGHQGTASECRAVGLEFLPFVAEAHGGGLGLTARRVCARVAKAAAARDGEEVEAAAAGIARSISSSIHRENARAVLRRLPSPVQPTIRDSPDVWAEAPGWQ